MDHGSLYLEILREHDKKYRKRINMPLFVFFLVCILAWLTHIIFCIKSALWIFLLAGAICFPIGIVHGIGLWFGVF